MTPAARIQAAIDILEGLSTSRLPADRFIREYFRSRRYAGSKDRAAVSERVYDAFRHRASYAWRMGSPAPRALVIASLLNEGADVTLLFTGDGYGPPVMTGEEKQHVASPPSGQPAPHIKGEYPQFLESELMRAFGGNLLEEMIAMQFRAPVDLRVNGLKAKRDDVIAALRAEKFEALPTRYSPLAIRLPAGTRGLEQNGLFLSGAFEFQDEAAQVAVLLAQARPGMRVLDLAAGAGGKSLALAAAMNNEGVIVAHDVDEGRLRQIVPRAARAGVTIIKSTTKLSPSTSFDLIFLDAPCSGSGTWRRAPENKWRLTSQRLDELNALQDMLLDQAAEAGTPRIVYATCSVLPCENEDRIAVFLARHPAYRIVLASEILGGSVGTDLPPGAGEFFRASPYSTATDGFFAAIMQRHG